MRTHLKMNKVAATIKVVLSLFCFILWLSSGEGMMPSYLPVTSTNSDRNCPIERYFSLGLYYLDIIYTLQTQASDRCCDRERARRIRWFDRISADASKTSS